MFKFKTKKTTAPLNQSAPEPEQSNAALAPSDAQQTSLTINDVLATSYLSVQAPPEATLNNTALLLIDIQHLATPAYLKEIAVNAGLPAKDVEIALADYKRRFEAAVTQCQTALTAARASGVPPIHVKIQSLCSTGRDTGALHRRMGWAFPSSNSGTQFLDEIKPLADEIVITKTASGAFTGTALDWTLRNMGIEHVFICGFVTDECVETTARAALDLGYSTKIISDATATYRAEDYEHMIAKFTGYGFTQTTDEVKQQFEQIGKAARA